MDKSLADKNTFLSAALGFDPEVTNHAYIQALKDALPDALSNLSDRQKQIVDMRFMRYMLLRDIAAELEVNPSTVSRTLARALNKLRHELSYVKAVYL